MRIAVYNQMFALNGKSFWSTLIGHYMVHFQKNEGRIWKRTNLQRTLNIIRKSKADIVGICEILEGQEKELESGLRKLGYKDIHFGDGHRTHFRHLQIKVAIASKFRCNKEHVKKEPTENALGGGGGFVECYFPKLKINVIHVHLGTRRHLREKQIKILKKSLKRREDSVLMGDFNCTYLHLKKYFGNLKLVTDRIKTCSLTPIIRIFHKRDDDHIFVRGLKARSAGFLEGFSDHRLIYVDLE